ncbi:MAG: redox-sensing transcriptional repressor Rex [Clostridia bacterium]|nr:redox-sensing transcriptional repressor Rex [Clostridia bacterium]
MKGKTISEAVIRRLPRYFRYLEELAEKGVERIPSSRIASALRVTASQVRQDLCSFGGFGQQGLGYNVEMLKNEIADILGLTRSYNMIIVGFGNVGAALAGYMGFSKEAFIFKAAFDIDTDKVVPEGLKLYSIDKIEDYLANNQIDIAVICTPKAAAQSVAERLVAAGITKIWNFAPIELDLPENITLENTNMSASLYMLTYSRR